MSVRYAIVNEELIALPVIDLSDIDLKVAGALDAYVAEALEKRDRWLAMTSADNVVMLPGALEHFTNPRLRVKHACFT